MNPSNHEPDAWLAVLAGQQVATDRATRHAAGLREYITRQIEAEREHQPDPIQEARLLARLRSRGAFAPQPTQSLRKIHLRLLALLSLIGRGSAWASGQTQRPAPDLQAGTGRNGVFKSRRTLALLGVIGVAASLVLLKNAGFWPREGGEPVQPIGIDRNIPGLKEVQVIISANPEQSAAQLKTLLAQAGVLATVTPEGTEIGASLLLQANLTPAQRLNVNAQIETLNVTVPVSGKLVVRFKKLL
jgi:hypothetical protein